MPNKNFIFAQVLQIAPLQVKPVVDITWFSWQLWRLTGRRGMTFLYLYSFMGFACLKLVTPDFALLAQVQQALEGAFRYTQDPCSFYHLLLLVPFQALLYAAVMLSHTTCMAHIKTTAVGLAAPCFWEMQHSD